MVLMFSVSYWFSTSVLKASGDTVPVYQLQLSK